MDFSELCSMHFIPENILQYAENHSDSEPELLQRLRRETHLHYLYARMLSGPLQGRLLSLLSKLIRPEYILEIGTYTGYSAICLAEGLQEKGKLISIELDPELRSIAEKYIKEAGFSTSIELYTGAALDIIPKLDYSYDLVFMDAEKYEYIDYFEAVIPRLNPGGIILADNVLWSGQVADDTFKDKKTQALRNFNAYIKQDIRVEVVMIPLRDGLSIIRKK